MRVDKLDIQAGRRRTVATAPVRRADFVTNRQGRIRFASGADVTNASKLSYRDNDDAPWRLINDAASSKHREFPLGFSADGSLAYMRVEQDTGTDVLAAWDPITGKSTPLLHDDTVDPYRILRDLDGITLIGASYMSDRVRNRFFDEKAPTAKRDGLELHGYLTRPLHAEAGTPLPLIVMPHGGPFGIFDKWEFDDDTQLLAVAGYAVLRVNYRGSANYGRSFTVAGAKEWGGRMQDDLTDATRWAIAQGMADASRVCLYGASDGGYAALMDVAKEPGLYRCAAGYMGVYDLDMMARDTARYARWAKNWTGDWLGARDTLAARSPMNLASQIKVPVFLAAGGKDERAPIEHNKRMERALNAAGVPVESLYFPNEGHGFYAEPHRRAYYTRLLAFLSKQLGGSTAK
ncbi:peptidase S9 [Xanthomonas oryzae pv. oryzicola]|nr:prolyl oligopeptidase family serine peptidase [Xanthomonas oryzae]QEO99311.1 peptidase S9 [Xanthomonas oryzae pv. oryzicola]